MFLFLKQANVPLVVLSNGLAPAVAPLSPAKMVCGSIGAPSHHTPPWGPPNRLELKHQWEGRRAGTESARRGLRKGQEPLAGRFMLRVSSLFSVGSFKGNCLQELGNCAPTNSPQCLALCRQNRTELAEQRSNAKPSVYPRWDPWLAQDERSRAGTGEGSVRPGEPSEKAVWVWPRNHWCPCLIKIHFKNHK